MKLIKTTLTAVLLLLTLHFSFAQNKDYKWALGLHWSGNNFEEPILNQYFTFKNMGNAGTISLSRYLNPSFDFQANYTYGKTFYPKFIAENSNQYKLLNLPLVHTNANLQYKFANGYMLKENAALAPFFNIGIGISNIFNKTNLDVIPGFGINLRAGDRFNVQIKALYHSVSNSYDYMQYSAGITYNFNLNKKMKDNDGDGVTNDRDRCPDAKGLAQFQGCPDTDGDGVSDRDDECPTLAGPASTFGCPDKDLDGIVDKKDKCPEKAGPPSLKGCPPTPDVISLPDTVQTTITKVVEEPEVVPQVQIDYTDPRKPRFVYFEFNSFDIKPSYYLVLDSISQYLFMNPSAKVIIEGHCDYVGSDAANNFVSMKRATSARDYLLRKGNRLVQITCVAKGKSNPIADNSTEEGRSKNSRAALIRVVPN